MVRKWVGNPSFVDKPDASNNPALRCGIVACKEHVLPKNKNSRERIGAYALSVQRSSVVLAIAFSMLSGYPVVTTNRRENGQHGTEKRTSALNVKLNIYRIMVSKIKWCAA